jgi:site-specific DNA-adenine methylase
MATTAYFGGKSSKVFRDFINTKIPKDGTVKKYMEPFSGSMGTYMDDKELNFDSVIYNDKNRHQVNLVKCCSEPEEFLKKLISFQRNGIKD